MNRQYFSNTDNYIFRYSITENGQKITEKEIPISLLAQQSTEVKVDLSQLSQAWDRVFYNFEVAQKEAGQLIPAGHIVAIEQFKLDLYAPKDPTTKH